MDEDEFDCEENHEHGPIVAKFSAWDLAIATFQMMAGICRSVESFWQYLLSAAVGAANKEMQDDRFHQEAALEIESLLREGETGDNA